MRRPDTSAVVLDFYGTLARAVSWGDTHEEVFVRHGLPFDNKRWGWNFIGETTDGQLHLEHSTDREAYVAWEHQRLRRRAAACGVAEPDLGALVADLHSASKTYTLEVYDDVVEVLADLRGRGLTVAICSNWDWDIDRAIAGAGLTGTVDLVVTSAQAGARKPHPRIFEHTLQRCRTQPAETLFAGDTMAADVTGPLAFGMRAVHIWRDDMIGEPDPLPHGAVRLPHLRGIADLL